MNDYFTYYKVENKDTLYEIGRKYNISSKLLAYVNGLKPGEYIYPGDILKVPLKGVEYYITKEDDTLKIVSGIFKTSEENIINQNKEIFLMPSQLIFYKE